MELYDRYLNGETETVYAQLYALGEKALTSEYFPQTELILIETFRRVWLNLNEIHKELRAINYQFVPNPAFDWQKPLTQPPASTKTIN